MLKNFTKKRRNDTSLHSALASRGVNSCLRRRIRRKAGLWKRLFLGKAAGSEVMGMWVTMKGKHLTVKIDLERYLSSPHPFFLVFTINEHLLIGGCWKGELEGDESDVYGFFYNLLTACYYFLRPESPHVQRITKIDKRNIEEEGFQLRGDEVVVYQAVERNAIYYACSTGRVARIYCHNELLEFTDCPEYKGKHRVLLRFLSKSSWRTF